MKQPVLKTSLVLAGITFFSRLLGFYRDLLIASLFGVSYATDAFFVAFKLPNFFRRLFTEGALAHVIIPSLHHCQTVAVQRKLVANLLAYASVLSLLLFVLAYYLSPWLVMLLAPGLADNAQQLATTLLRLCVLYIALLLPSAIVSALLNAKGYFRLVAFVPAILNLSIIFSTLYLSQYYSIPISALAVGVSLAGVLQLLIQLPALKRINLLVWPHFRPPRQFARSVFTRLIPAVFALSATQFNFVFDALVASFLDSGSVSWLYYSDRLVEFPVGILAITLGTLILPQLADAHAKQQTRQFSALIDTGLRLTLLLGLPAMLGLILMAKPLLITLFYYQHFTLHDVEQSTHSLQAYALGLPAYMMLRVLVAACSAQSQLNIASRYGMIAMIASLLLNVLAIPFAHAGLALATSIGAWLNALLLFKHILTTHSYRPQTHWWRFALQILIANSVLGLLLHQGIDERVWLDSSALIRIAHSLAWIVSSILIYTAILYLLGFKTAINHAQE